MYIHIYLYKYVKRRTLNIYILVEVKMGRSEEAVKQLEKLTGLDLHSNNAKL